MPTDIERTAAVWIGLTVDEWISYGEQRTELDAPRYTRQLAAGSLSFGPRGGPWLQGEYRIPANVEGWPPVKGIAFFDAEKGGHQLAWEDLSGGARKVATGEVLISALDLEWTGPPRWMEELWR